MIIKMDQDDMSAPIKLSSELTGKLVGQLFDLTFQGEVMKKEVKDAQQDVTDILKELEQCKRENFVLRGRVKELEGDLAVNKPVKKGIFKRFR